MMGGADDWPRPYHDADVVVLGGTGFIGRWTARQLAALGANVHVTVRDLAAWECVAEQYDLHAIVHEVDAGEVGAVTAVLREIGPATTFNLIGYGVDRSETDPLRAELINTVLPASLVSAIADQPRPWPGPRLVHVGSAAEYGAVSGDLDEETSARPVGVYGRTKWAGTVGLAKAARERELSAVTARIFTVYGPGEHDGRLLPSLLNAAANPGVLPLTAGLQRRDFTYVEDVVEGLLRLGVATTVTPGEVVNLCTGVLTSVRTFIEEAARVLPIPSERLGFGAMPERAGEMDHDPVSVARCRSHLGWIPTTPVAEGIRRTADFRAG